VRMRVDGPHAVECQETGGHEGRELRCGIHIADPVSLCTLVLLSG
jgi:hypothetical protein